VVLRDYLDPLGLPRNKEIHELALIACNQFQEFQQFNATEGTAQVDEDLIMNLLDLIALHSNDGSKPLLQ